MDLIHKRRHKAIDDASVSSSPETEYRTIEEQLKRTFNFICPINYLFRQNMRSIIKSKRTIFYDVVTWQEKAENTKATSTTDAIPVLYTYFRSSCSWRVRIALNLKGISYTPRFVNLIKNEQRSSDYVQLNADKKLPTLVVANEVFTQSIAILEYLEEVYQDVPLLPKDPKQRAHVRALVQAIASDIQPIGNLSVLKYVGDDKMAEWSKHWITLGFEAVESRLKTSSGKYCVGDIVTLADVCLVPQVYNAKRWKVDMSKFHTITRVSEALCILESFQKADWKAQEDCPEELKKNGGF